ncbi:MAG: hypothetical protein IJ272_10895, partial [Clostridia bacterium]|nr:hypothetical protein [Clostridia bacterium]
MKHKGKKKLSSYIKMSLALVSVIGTTLLSNVSVAKAEDLIHTHIWATKYDKTKHWEYCTVCKKTRNESKHDCKDNWFIGKASCTHLNYNTKICACGYNYVETLKHVSNENWNNTGSRLVHYKTCKDCGNWTTSARCKDAEGELSCKNTGTCTVCGVVALEDYHIISTDGKCRTCKIQLVEMSVPKVTYASDYSTATITFRLTPKHSSLKLTGKMSNWTKISNYTSRTWKGTVNSDGSCDYTGVFTFDSKKQTVCTVNIGDIRGAAKFNDKDIYMSTGTYKHADVQIWQDHTKPEVTEVKQVDQKLHNTWATIKELTINGNEDLSANVTLTITDPATGDIIVDKAKTTVVNGKYSYKCTPPLEGPAEGRKYKLTVTDEVGNVTDKEFTIYKTDCRAPLLRSAKEYTEWSKTKNLELELTDYGSGSPQSSLGSQTSYKDTKVVNGKYYACYTFSEDKYDVSEYKLYVRDGLGNAGVETIKVGKVDNTKPTITDVKGEVKDMEMYITAKDSSTGEAAPAPTAPTNPEKYAHITVTANDLNKKLNKEGSKVAGYALTTSKETPNKEAWQTINCLAATKPGTYYLWVKDNAGNIADLKVITVKDDFTIEVGDKDIVVDVPEDEKYAKPDTEKEDTNKKEDGNKTDDTPKTADGTAIYLLGALLLVSGAVMVIVRC